MSLYYIDVLLEDTWGCELEKPVIEPPSIHSVNNPPWFLSESLNFDLNCMYVPLLHNYFHLTAHWPGARRI